MSRRLGLSCAIVFALLVAAPCWAAEGRVPIFLPGPVPVPGGAMIEADGSYILTRNLFGAGPVVTICAQNVDLDLNGKLVMEVAGSGPVISVGGAGCVNNCCGDHVKIHNGFLGRSSPTVRGGPGAAGIEALGFLRKIDVEDIQIHDQGGPSIHLGDVMTAAIRRVEIIGGSTGILWDGADPFSFKSGTIEDNLIRSVSAGISVANACSSVGILNNRIEEIFGLGYGISLSGCEGSLVSENTVEGCTGEGIVLVNASSGNKLFDNVVRDCNSHGIHICPDCQDNLVLNNVSTGNGAVGSDADGILVEGPFNKIDGNLVNSNTGVGLHFCAPSACGNSFMGNTGRANGGLLGGCGPCAAFPPAAAPDACDMAGCATPNTSAGQNVFVGVVF